MGTVLQQKFKSMEFICSGASVDVQLGWSQSVLGGKNYKYTAVYPTGLTGVIHTDGQIWASALMRIYDKIGKQKTDRAFLEGLALTGSSTNQQEAAIAVRQAAIDMLGQFGFTCTDVNTITEEFTNTGYVLPTYTCMLSAEETSKKEIIAIYPNPVSDVLHVSMKINKEQKVEIYNMEGRKALEAMINSNKNTINVSNLPTGDYILTIKGMEISTKFIKK